MAIFEGLGRYQNIGILLMRVGLGFMMVMHGYPKLFGGPEKWERIGGAMSTLGIDFAPVFWGFMASAAEGIGGLFLILGFFFRPTCALLIITMVVAALRHIIGENEGFMGGSSAIELGIAFLGLFIIGPGKYSIDKK